MRYLVATIVVLSLGAPTSATTLITAPIKVDNTQKITEHVLACNNKLI